MTDLKVAQALEELAAESRPEPGRWPVIERRIRRRHAFRLATSIVLTAVVVVGAVGALRLGPWREADFAGPDPSVSGSPSAFRDEQNNFQISVPAGWSLQGYQSGVPGITLSPSGDEAANEVSIEVFMNVGVAHDDHTGFGDSPFQILPKIDDASAVRWEEVVHQSAGNKRRVAYRIDWTGRRASWADQTCSSGDGCDPRVATLAFLVSTPNDELWERYGDAAEQIVRSTIRLDDVPPELWMDAVVHTPWGRVEPGVLYDAKTEILVQFLDIRAGGGDIARVYKGPPIDSITGYRVIGRTDPDLDTAQFTVEVRGPETSTEILAVGSDGMVRLVGPEAAPTLTPGGSVAAGIKNDAYTERLVEFLDARLRGSGAEDFICCEATSREKSKWYAYADYDMVGYRVTERNTSNEATSGGNPYFIVEIIYEQGAERHWNGTIPMLQEFIVVGPDDSGKSLKVTKWSDEGTS